MQCSRLFYPSAWLPRRAMHCGQKVTRLFDIENAVDCVVINCVAPNRAAWPVPVSCKNLSGREKISASRDFTVCIMRCVYRAELILGR